MTDITHGVRLPYGPFCTRSTRYDEPLLSLDMTNIEVIERTDNAGWPTVVVGETDGTDVGVAISYPAQWRDKPAEEIDIFYDVEGNWWALVEFRNLAKAKATGQYERYGYDGFEVLDRSRADEGFELFREYADNRVTPLFEMPDDAVAFAIQRANDFETLTDLFQLGIYPNLEGRYTRLEKQVLPHDEWVSQNDLSDIARDLTDNESN
jgi:hypothetical protein